MIPLLTNDGRIRAPDQFILDVVSTMQTTGQARINTMSEGPCCEHVGLYSLLDKICNQFNFDHSCIHIYTSNMLESHTKYHVHKNFNFWELERSIINSQQFSNSEKKFDSEFKHFGNFIGHSNKYRLQTSSYLKAQYSDKTLQSYHCKVTEEYHREYIGLEDLMFIGATESMLDIAYNHIKQAPIELDTITTFPILQPTNINLLKYYPKFFLEIVNLTFFSGTTFYVDEKVWRPVLALTPIMVQGPSNFIKNLRRMGFKTFHQWWDEGYSEDPDGCQVPCIFNNIEHLSKLSICELQSMYQDMLPTLKHNRDLLLDFTKKDIERVFND